MIFWKKKIKMNSQNLNENKIENKIDENTKQIEEKDIVIGDTKNDIINSITELTEKRRKLSTKKEQMKATIEEIIEESTTIEEE